MPTYLRTVNNQLNAIFNHAERYYGLTDNPVRRAKRAQIADALSELRGE